MATQAQINKLLLDRVADLTKRVASLEAKAHIHGTPDVEPPPPVEPPPVDPPPTPTTRPIYGYGQQVTGGAGKAKVHVTTLAASGVGSLAYAMQGSDRHIVFDVAGTIVLPAGQNVDCRGANITVDGASAPGKGITVTGERIQLAYGARNIILTDIRHRGKLAITGSEQGNNVTAIRDVAGVIFARLSLSGTNDESVALWDGARDVTVQDCIVGPGANPGVHDYAILAGGGALRTSIHHNLMYGLQYRNPAIGWDQATPNGEATDLVGDVIGNLTWGYTQYGITVYWGGKANVVKNYTFGAPGSKAAMELSHTPRTQAFVSGNYAKDGRTYPAGNHARFAVPAYAVVPEEATAKDAALSVLDKAGCRVGGLDAFDQAIIDAIKAIGL